MLTRREFFTVAVATAALTGVSGRLASLAARQALRQEDLLRFTPLGQVTILHMSDTHAQLLPSYVREPSINIGAGDMRGVPPRLSDQAFLDAFGITPGSAEAYCLTSADFDALARTYGRVGGMDRLATIIKAIRAERGEDRVLLLDGGDTLQGSYTALATKGGDMVQVIERLGVEATTGHWEFTLGADRIIELFGGLGATGQSQIPFLAGNIVENDFDEPVFPASRVFEKGGVKIAVIGQAFPYTPIANPRWMMPQWSFGIREEEVRRNVESVREEGADLVVLLSHNGFDLDRKLAQRVAGIDVILTAHTHDALPVPTKVGDTLLIASGSNGKFLSRLDLEVKDRRVTGYRYALIPLLADAITPDPDMARLVQEIRAPHEAMLGTELAVTATTLYRRGNFNGTLDDLICNAMLAERDAEIAFSPGFRWGPTLLPGEPITWDDLYNATAITYPACYRTEMTGMTIRQTLESIADNLFNPDPYYRQGGDMVRVGGMSYTIDLEEPFGRRIKDMTLARTGQPIEPDRRYTVSGWASVNRETQGPPIWEVVAHHLLGAKTVNQGPSRAVRLVRG